MNQGFKLKYNEMQENNPANNPDSAEQAPKAGDDKYTAAGHVRNICFVWIDGKRMFLSYAYLISGEYDPEISCIELNFTTHKIVLKGIDLQELFYEIMSQMVRQIICSDSRYNEIDEIQKSIVNEVVITKSSV